MAKIKKAPRVISLTIDSVDISGRGVGRLDGKVCFVENALPSERVEAVVVKEKSSFIEAEAISYQEASVLRTAPKCPHFGVCAGCVMQHIEPTAQVAIKQRALEEVFVRVGKVPIPQIMSPMHGPYWQYRSRARLSVRWVPKKGGALVGFREKNPRYVAEIQSCAVLPEVASRLIMPLRSLVGTLSRPDTIAQFELAVSHDDVVILVIRHLEPLTEQDTQQLLAFADLHKVVWWLQSKGLDSLTPLKPTDQDALFYNLPAFDLKMSFKPADFTQVNQEINQSLVSKAIRLLDVQSQHRVLDLFCGLGNFTLPLAKTVSSVVGVEGSAVLVKRAQDSAAMHGLAEKAQFFEANLFEISDEWLRNLGHFDRMLIDPPRAGAQELMQILAQTACGIPEKIVYVSCDPATLARDAGILVQSGRYRLTTAGVVNMFPHTAHIESIAVFDKII